MTYQSVVLYAPEGNPNVPDYVAYCPELPGCMAQGRTVKEARANLEDVRIFWIQCLRDDSLTVPPPRPFNPMTVIGCDPEGGNWWVQW